MRPIVSFTFVVATALAASDARAVPQFLNYFPNSSVIDGNGCVNCHVSPFGGGARNTFGQAMANNSFDWASVCSLDSDGDGQTNGQELGDPDCIWSGSGPGARTSAISNPGQAASTSSDPNGGAQHAGEGEGTAGEGEGEGEGAATHHVETPSYGCAATNATPLALFGLVVLVARRRRIAA